MPNPLPVTFADLTVAWLNEALVDGAVEGSGLVATVASMNVEPLAPDAGLLGDLARLWVTYDRGTGPASFIVKLPTQEPGGREVGTMLRAWAREVAFYREVAPQTPGIRVPRCYAAQADEAAGRWVVVLEDCPSDEADFLTGATIEQAQLAVDALGDFHATWWERGDDIPWMPSVDADGFAGLQAVWAHNIPTFLERYATVLPDDTATWVERFAVRLADWARGAAAQPLTIVHADYRLDNLIFNGPTVTMIDWQTALRGPGAMDLSCFLATSLATDVRRQVEVEMIERYQLRLALHGVVVDDVWLETSYDENLLWWMGQFANNLAHLQPKDPATAEALKTMVVRTYTAAHDRNVGRLL